MLNWAKNNVTAIIAMTTIIFGFVGNHYQTSIRLDSMEKQLTKISENYEKVDKLRHELEILKLKQGGNATLMKDIKGLIEKNTQALNNNTSTSKVLVERLENLDKRVQKLEDK